MSKAPAATVELRVALEWTCDGCGRDNYERVGWIDGDEGMTAVYPLDVQCRHCGAKGEAEWIDAGIAW